MEVLVILTMLFFLALFLAMLLPALATPRHHSRNWCSNNLMQVALSSQLWAGDNNDKLPMEISVTNGGAMELAAAGNATAVFQVMSNELGTPRVLLCPKDLEHGRASDFGPNFNRTNVSYFIAQNPIKGAPQSILAGDDNIESGVNPMKPGLRLMSSNIVYHWSATRHVHYGTIVSANGSVLSLTDSPLNNLIRTNDPNPVRIAIP